ncbi:MAG: hypothetical protein ABSD31_04960 [Candidatus Binataceae bacterium]|jgi:hypothetical protein
MQLKANQLERTDDLRAAVLWIHVLSGAIGIGACACLAIAVSALTAGSDEFRDFAIRGVPALNRVNVVAAATVVVTGVTRLLIMMVAGGFVPSAMFIDVLLMKVALFAGMAIALAGSIRAAAVLKADGGSGAESAPSARKVAMFSGLAAGLGGAAMMLGAWLVGS